jgi:hypothetical protein
MEKRKITAREVLKDIRAGVDDSELMNKYQLSAQGLQSVFTKLVTAGIVAETELEDRVPVSERTVDLGLFICPACGHIQGQEFVDCPRCGFSVPRGGKGAKTASSGKKTGGPTVQGERTTRIESQHKARLKTDSNIVQKTDSNIASKLDTSTLPRPDLGISTVEANIPLDGLKKIANYCKILGIAAMAIYVLVFAGMLVVHGAGPSSLTATEWMGISLMGIPVVVIGLIMFVMLKALTESVKIFSSISESAAKRLSS